MAFFYRCQPWLLVVPLLVAPAAAVAQEEASEADVQRARALFGEGVELMDQGRHEEALEKFRATFEIRQAPAVHFNLALAYYELGRHGRAIDHLEVVRDDRETARDMRRQARVMIREVRSQVGMVTVTLEGEDLEEAEVQLDDWTMPAELVGQPVRAVAGTHQVSVRRGDVTAEHSVDVVAWETVEVTLQVAAPTPRETAEAGLQHEDDETLTDEEPLIEGALVEQWWFWVAVGIVAGGAILATVAVAQPEDPTPVQGDLMPGILQVAP